MDCDLLQTEGCEWCGKPLTGRRTRWCSAKCNREFRANHRYTNAKQLAKKAATYYRCESCSTFTQTVEVNHIVPCKGKHGVWGCWHHQDNLEVLCKPCHLKTTAQQRAEGKL